MSSKLVDRHCATAKQKKKILFFKIIGIEESGDNDEQGFDNPVTEDSLGDLNRSNSNVKNRVSPTQDIDSTPNRAAVQASNKMYVSDEKESPSDGQIPKTKMVDGKALRKQRYLALCRIRALLILRNPEAFIFRIIFPALFIIIGSAVMRFGPKVERTDSTNSVKLHAGLYSKVNGEDGNNNPDMLLQTQWPAVPNVTDFNSSLEQEGIELQSITDTSDLLSIVPHHMGLHIYAVNATADPITSTVTVIYNNSAFHSIPATVNVISNTLLKMLTDAGNTVIAYVKFWPNLTQKLSGYDQTTVSSVILLGLGMSTIPPAFGIAVVYDREVCSETGEIY